MFYFKGEIISMEIKEKKELLDNLSLRVKEIGRSL